MKVLTALLLTVNTALVMAILFGPTTTTFDAGMAKLVVRERLDRIPVLGQNIDLKMSRSCAEQQGSNGVVSGQAQVAATAKILEGMPIHETTNFSYRAQLNAICWPYNLNCYKVDSMIVDGTQAIAPKL